MTENETIPGAFKALRTGYGIVGFDYACIPATSVPEFSLQENKITKKITNQTILNKINSMFLLFMVFPVGLEPTTPKLKV